LALGAGPDRQRKADKAQAVADNPSSTPAVKSTAKKKAAQLRGAGPTPAKKKATKTPTAEESAPKKSASSPDEKKAPAKKTASPAKEAPAKKSAPAEKKAPAKKAPSEKAEPKTETKSQPSGPKVDNVEVKMIDGSRTTVGTRGGKRVKQLKSGQWVDF
jgi:membrane protein involved in colicin uptake